MAVVSSGDRNTIRNAKMVEVRLTLNLLPLTEVASAEIASAPAGYPVASLAVTNTSGWANIGVGKAFAIKNSDGEIITWGVQRKASTSTVFFNDAKSRGDGGYARDIHHTIQAGDTLHVYAHRPPWGLLSRATGTAAYKAWDIPYTGQNSAPAPVVVMGAHQQAYVDANGKARFTFDFSQSYDLQYGVNAITSNFTTLPPGATVVAGGITQDSITIEVDAGVHEIAHTVQSITGRTATGYRWLFANKRVPDNTTATAFSDRFAVSAIAGDTQTKQGREITVEVAGDLTEEIYPGQMCLLTTRYLYDGVELESSIKSFVGYLSDVVSEIELNNNTARLTFRSPLVYARTIPTATQLLDENPNPTEWIHVVPGLANPTYAAYYCMKYHSNLLDSHDYIYEIAIRGLRRRTFSFQQTNIQGQLNFIAEVGRGQIGCRSDGTITFNRIGDLMDNTDRNALDEKYTWDEYNIGARVSINPRLKPEVAQIIIDAISHDGSDLPGTYRAIAPGYAAGQGQGISDATAIIVTPAEGQDKLERIAGHKWAYENNPLASLRLPVANMVDILEPADNDWHLIKVPTRYLNFTPNRFGLTWKGDTTGFRVTPNTVVRSWRKAAFNVWVCDIEGDVRVTTFGQKGEYLPVDAEEGWNWQSDDGWLSGFGDFNFYLQDSPEFDLGEDFAFCMAWNHLGEPGRSFNFLAESVVWQDARGESPSALPGHVVDMGWYYASAGASIYAVTHDADEEELYIYSTSNALADAITWTLRKTIATDDTFTGLARYTSSKTQDLQAMAYLTTEGVIIYRYGSGTWDNGTLVGLSTEDADATTFTALGLHIEGNVFYVSGQEAAGHWVIYRATGKAGSFSKIPNHPGAGWSQTAAEIIHQRTGGDLLVSYFIDNTTIAGSTISTWSKTANILNLPNESSESPNTWSQYGFDVVRQTAEQLAGVDYTVEGITGQFKTTLWYEDEVGDPPGNSGSPEVYFPPGGSEGTAAYEYWKVEVTLEVALLDKEGSVLWSKLVQWHSLDLSQPYSITYAPTPMAFSRVRFEIAQTISETFTTPIEGVRYLRYRFLSDNPENFGFGEFTDDSIDFNYFAMTGAITSMDITEKVEYGKRLYSIDGSDVWTNITPDDERVPFHKYGLTRESSNAEIVVVGQGATGKRELLRTANSGTTWSTGRSTGYNWVRKLQDDVFVLGGADKLDLSADDLKTVHRRLGNWGQAIGVVGNIEGALIAVENP